MAFGAVKGTWTFTANSIVANNQATLNTGSSTVAVGDLIVVVIGEQTGNTSTGASDTLGNTYTAATVGTLGGGVSGRAFYSIVTVAGTNTNVNVAATASANNVAIVAACYEGSYSAVDKTPANNNNTDNASPFTCPATGTLAQQVEIVIAWMVDNTSNTKTATSPNLKDNQANSQTVLSTTLGHQVVNSTSTVSPAWTGTNPTGSQQGTLSFRAADLASVDRKVEFRNVATGHFLPFPLSLRTWTQTFQLTPPAAPPADTMPLPFDWGLADGPPRDTSLSSWMWTQQRTVAAAPFSQYDWPLPIAPPLLRPFIPPWIQPVAAAAVDTTNLPRAFDWGLAEGPPPLLQTWFVGPSLNLRAAIVVTPFSETDWPLPRSSEYPLSLRSWLSNLQQGTLRPFPVGERIDARPDLRPLELLRSWTASYNLNLIAQDALPVGERVTDVPAGIIYPQQLRTWIGGKVAEAAAVPFNQTDWPNPRPPLVPQRSWAWNYNVNLIGQDQLPVGEQRYDLTPAGYIHPAQLRTWVAFTNLALVTPPAPRPFAQIDWPLPRAPQQAAFGYTWSYNLNLVGKDQLPAGDQVYDLAPRDDRPYALRSWTWNYNYNLIGQDRLPTGEQRIELTPAGHIYPQQLRTWIDFRSRAVDFVAGAQPDGERFFDLPPRDDRPYAVRSWTWSYNLNLIGKDALPVGKILSGLPQPIDLDRGGRTWIQSVNLALTSVAARPFVQTDWPLPQWPLRSITLRTWIASVNDALILGGPRPFGQQHWPLNPGPRQPDRSFAAKYNDNLVGKDRLPFRQQDWPLQPDLYRDAARKAIDGWQRNVFIGFMPPTIPPPPTIAPRDPTHLRTRSGFEISARGHPIDRRGSDTPRRGRNES